MPSKPVDRLTMQDFAEFPVWEFASDQEGDEGRDETWVRPVAGRGVPARSYVLASADFEAACGRRFEGYVFVSTFDGEPECCQGVLFSAGRGFFVSNPEAVIYQETRAEILEGLDLDEAELFPLSFRLRVPIEGMQAPWSGMLP